MGQSEFANVISPEVIESSIGNSWANELALVKYAPQVFVKDSRPITQGTLVSAVRNTFFQGESGQAIGAGQDISSVGRVQSKENHPVIWRYGSIDENDVIAEIAPKDVAGAMDVNAQYAQAGTEAGAQWLEDSLVSMIEGVAGALTSNQAGSGATATLANLIEGKAALADQGLNLNGGAAIMRSELYWMLTALGAIAQASNTFSGQAADEILRTGMLPANFLGGYAFPMDKLAAAPGTDHYLYFIGAQSIVLRAYSAPELEFARKTALKQFGWVMNLKFKFAAGFKGVSWNAAGSDKLSDLDLSTSANWTLADSASKYVRIARVLTDNN